MSFEVQRCTVCGTVNFPAKYVCAKCHAITFEKSSLDEASVSCFTKVEKRAAGFPYAWMVELQVPGAHILAVSDFEPRVGETLKFEEPSPGLLVVRR